MSTDTPPPTTSYTISQQAVNVIIQLVSAKGWPDTLVESYDGGRLVSRYLNKLIDLTWVKTEAQLKTLTADDLAAYQKQDREWGSATVEVKLTDKQVAIVRKSFKHFIGELLKAKQLGPNPVFEEIIDAFAIPLEEAKAKE